MTHSERPPMAVFEAAYESGLHGCGHRGRESKQRCPCRCVSQGSHCEISAPLLIKTPETENDDNFFSDLCSGQACLGPNLRTPESLKLGRGMGCESDRQEGASTAGRRGESQFSQWHSWRQQVGRVRVRRLGLSWSKAIRADRHRALLGLFARPARHQPRSPCTHRSKPAHSRCGRDRIPSTDFAEARRCPRAHRDRRGPRRSVRWFGEARCRVQAQAARGHRGGV